MPLIVVASLALIGDITVQHPLSTLARFGYSVLGALVDDAWRAARRVGPRPPNAVALVVGRTDGDH